MRPILFTLVFFGLSGCFEQPLAAIRIGCGFADVLIAETDLEKVNNSFLGSESPMLKVCRAVRAIAAPPSGVPADGIEDGPITLNLPNGESVSVTIIGNSS